MTAVCTCGAELSGRRSHAPDCALVRLALAPKPKPRGFRGGGSRFATAQPTACALAHRHPSKTEARVCDRLHAQLLPGERLVRQVRLPLIATPNPDGTLLAMTVDFGIVKDGRLVRLIDAKSGSASREWLRGKRALEASWHIPVEETDR